MSVITVQSVKMETAIMVLSIFFVSGAADDCQKKEHLLITTPEKMEALSGSCLQIPCNFSANINAKETFNGIRSSFGVWIKNTVDFVNNPDQVIFNSSRTNIYPVSLIGDLSQKNCTTLFSSVTKNYTDKYYFRVENRPFLATAHCSPLQITVKDSPRRPSIEIPGDLQEKQSVTITCSAFTPCPHSPPQLTWNLQQDPHNTREENTDGTFTTKIQKIITLSDEHDGFNITCSARYPVNEGKYKTAKKKTTLSVSYAPKNTLVSISPSGLVSAGSQVTLTCSSRANPPASFTWFKSNKDGDVRVSEGDFYSFNVTSVTDIGDYYCVATNTLGSQTSPRINYAGSSDSLLLWGSALGGILVIILVCIAIYVWWFKSKRQTPQTQSQRGDELALQMAASTAGEEIRYGEIDFSKRRPEPSSASEQDSGQQQDTLYAQVKVSQAANKLTQPAVVPEDLYAQVMKK